MMVHWLKNASTFVLEWFTLALVGGSVVTWIVKIIAALITVVAAGFAIKEEIRFAGFSIKTDAGMETVNFTWPISAAWVIVVPVVIVWLAIAGGITWARFKRLEISDFRYNYSEGCYTLTVANLGIVGRKIPVRIESVADSQMEQSLDPLPTKAKYDGETDDPLLHNGIPYKVKVVHVRTGVRGNPFSPSSLYVEKVDVWAIIAEVAPGDKRWVAISFDGNIKWFSFEALKLEANTTSSPFKIALEPPPFLRTPSMARRYCVAFWVLVLGIFDGRMDRRKEE